jgi:hypothetical protein
MKLLELAEVCRGEIRITITASSLLLLLVLPKVTRDTVSS